MKTPKSIRLHIGIFGRANTGKSAFLNMIAGQDVSITSPVEGTTTDIVYKTMEILPIGPVVFMDTAGLDDASELSELRIKKSMDVFEMADIAFLITEAEKWTAYEERICEICLEKSIPLIIAVNKIDIRKPSVEFISLLKNKSKSVIEICSIASDEKYRNMYVNDVKKAVIENIPDDFVNPPVLVSDLIPPSGFAVLIVPIDLQAPKGRLILPQVQVMREILDNDGMCAVVKEREYPYFLKKMNCFPDIVICDSQVVLKMVADTPKDVKCTTFSILFSRFKGDLMEMVKGVLSIENLKNGDKVLIAESCSHHAAEDDIGRVKIPRWLRQYTGLDLEIDVFSGYDFPENLSEYKLVIHCGGCMINRRRMLSRIEKSSYYGVPITNYGVCISYLQGVLERVLSPFPYVLEYYRKHCEKGIRV